MLGMDMSEKMGFEIVKGPDPFEYFLRAIVDAVVEIKDSVGRRMGDQNFGICGGCGHSCGFDSRLRNLQET